MKKESDMLDFFNKITDKTPYRFPAEWNAQVVLIVDGVAITISFSNGSVLFQAEESSNPESIIHLSDERICSYIDGTIDFMSVWRELAEPSATDRTYIKKGSGAKFFTLIDVFIKQYKKDAGFRKMVDDYKAGL